MCTGNDNRFPKLRHLVSLEASQWNHKIHVELKEMIQHKWETFRRTT